VTNKHVIADLKSLVVRFIGAEDSAMTRPALGQLFDLTIEDPDQVFIGHPDPDIDVAIAPLSPMLELVRQQGFTPFFRSTTPAMLMTEENAKELDAMESITFVGYPNGLFDDANGLPIARQGVTATPPTVDYGGEPIFLVDASVFPGSSGSPVMIAQTGGYSLRGEGFKVGERFMLLGVMAAVYQREVPVLRTTSDRSFVEDTLDIGLVYKGRAIDEVADVFLDRHGLERYAEPVSEPISQPAESQDPLEQEQAGPG
jgi:hypothetical protein